MFLSDRFWLLIQRNTQAGNRRCTYLSVYIQYSTSSLLIHSYAATTCANIIALKCRAAKSFNVSGTKVPKISQLKRSPAPKFSSCCRCYPMLSIAPALASDRRQRQRVSLHHLTVVGTDSRCCRNTCFWYTCLREARVAR